MAQRLDITVSAGEQTYTLQALADLINAGVRMVQPDIVKMGGITGLMQCAALCPRARRRTRAAPDAADHRPRRQPARAATIMHLTKPAEYADPSGRMDIGFKINSKAGRRQASRSRAHPG